MRLSPTLVEGWLERLRAAGPRQGHGASRTFRTFHGARKGPHVDLACVESRGLVVPGAAAAAAALASSFVSEPYPEGPARHLDVSRQKLTPYCLAAVFDSQLPSPKLSLKVPPKLPLPHKKGHFLLSQNCPRGEGNCAAIERQKLSRGNFCLAASKCLAGPSG